MDKRTILAVALSLAVLLGYQLFIAKPPVPKNAAAPQQSADQIKKDKAASTVSAATAIATAAKPAERTKAVKPEAPARDVTVETPNYTAIFSTRGAALKSLKLKKYYQDCYECTDDIWPKVKGIFTNTKEAVKPKTKDFVELVDVRDGMPYPLAVTFPDSSADVAPDAVFDTTAGKLDLINSKEKQQLVFSKSYDNIKIEKVFTIDPKGYVIGLEVKVYNLTGSPITQIPRINWYQHVDPQKIDDEYGHEGPAVSVGGSIERQEVKKLENESILGPNVLWGAFESKYFIASFIPEKPSVTSVAMTRDANNMIAVGMKGGKELIPGGQNSVFSYSLYLGPKQYDLLKTLGVGLESAIDFGWFWWLAIPAIWILNFLYGFVLNYGIAIIILTTIIKIIFWPLGNLSYKSMNEMKKLQPKIEALKEKYKNDQSKIGQETMALYREHKVNPFSGCLPMLIQIPVFFGLYKALMYSIELRHSPLFFWIQDLSAKDPYYITPIIMGATQFITQKMTPAMGDPMQQKIMLFMPVIFTFFFLNFPSGLVIYWLFNNILQIGQQYYINKKLAA
ncbi:MAG: protein translocase component YidC [Deltaproteobacteria bacterium HGW-Deltaproteobacteria-6]|jgi:YidC/Oxa1 family membrane protein insertase|nr:MAG: protein translocase component YidC [Deltaproteobacteria bacterium HGW-Deltaproteobacteria-6]